MPEISIDFEVFKELTNRRPTEDVTYNDVLRELLKLPKPSTLGKAVTNGSKAWVVSGTSFPPETAFIAEYKGNTFTGLVKDGKLVLSDGAKFSTPSAAAVH